MPAPYPEEFKRRALKMVEDGVPFAEAARQLGVAESGLRRWADQAAVDTGKRPGLSSDERKELADLRRKNRRLEMENEILKRAAALFAQENVLPK
jgi:transposase